MEAGRYLGGYPKYMASFVWQLDPATGAPVNVTVRATNRTILRIVGLKPPSSAASAATAAGADSGVEAAGDVHVVTFIVSSNAQWPIYPPGIKKPASNVPLIASQEIDIGSEKAAFYKAEAVYLDALMLTGNAAVPVLVDSAMPIISTPAGTKATVEAPTDLTCA
ncbi:hypothetical protein OEZ86_007815 [Tetradesmus obliquus]|nr:hypothetical protein OEZ86_007815 [Tetradesmus obliquus]